MLPFWPDVLEPALARLRPEVVVEIGAESGKCTHRLLELSAGWGGRVHAVDPAPRFEVAAWEARYGERFVMHQAPSLEVIPRLERFDVVLIDGDHNWYTVFHELTGIEERASALDHPMPLMFLHDVAWPYGRRDLYYDPETIPAEHRQPWAKRGMSPTSSELVDSGGFNAHLCHAEHEGGPKNGVLTAVEDFLAVSKTSFTFVRIPAVFGLAILVPDHVGEAHPELLAAAKAWAVPEVARFIDRMETARIAMLTGLAARAR
ncbi:MAG: class I SAM-dependent methyltransferase [Polyangiaceae bacterium]